MNKQHEIEKLKIMLEAKQEIINELKEIINILKAKDTSPDWSKVFPTYPTNPWTQPYTIRGSSGSGSITTWNNNLDTAKYWEHPSTTNSLDTLVNDTEKIVTRL